MTVTRGDSLVELLDLEPIEVNIFRGVSRAGSPTRSFGGLVAAQALTAAGRTVEPQRPVHSLHAYFLLPGDSDAPIVYLVDRIRDGRSFTTRRISAVQHGQTIFHLSASFHRHEEGASHQDAPFDAPPPDSLPTLEEQLAAHPGALGRWAGQMHMNPVELRYIGEPPQVAALRGARPPRQQMWFRSRFPLPPDPLMHVCAATYASDLYLLSTTLLPHGADVGQDGVATASLDHAMWFHAPFRADEWLLYSQDSPWAGGARGLAHGQIFTQDGVLVASVMQEGLIRPNRRKGSGEIVENAAETG